MVCGKAPLSCPLSSFGIPFDFLYNAARFWLFSGSFGGVSLSDMCYIVRKKHNRNSWQTLNKPKTKQEATVHAQLHRVVGQRGGCGGGVGGGGSGRHRRWRHSNYTHCIKKAKKELLLLRRNQQHTKGEGERGIEQGGRNAHPLRRHMPVHQSSSNVLLGEETGGFVACSRC